MLSVEQKERQITVSQELLARYVAEGDPLLDRIVTGEDFMSTNYEPKSTLCSRQ